MMTTATAIDLADCRRARNRWLLALRKQNRTRAVQLLVRGYLPALRDLAAGTDPARIEDALDEIEQRLEKGWHYSGADQQRAEELFSELAGDYVVLTDCKNLQYEGTPMHPTRYLMDHLEVEMKVERE